MKLIYRSNPNTIDIQETDAGQDVEFLIRLIPGDPAQVDAMRHVQNYFDSNRVYTDVSFYAYQNHEYRIIVRKDFYVEFIIEMMRFQLLHGVEWSS